MDRVQLFTYWTILPVAVVGAIVLRRHRRPLYALLAFVVTTAVAVAITYGETRYRATAEVSIVLLAGIGFDALLRRVNRLPRGSADGVRHVGVSIDEIGELADHLP